MKRLLCRAWQKICHTKKNTCRLLLVFAILSFLMCSGGSLLIAAARTDLQTDHAVGGILRLYMKSDGSGGDSVPGMDLSLLKSLEKDPGIQLTYELCTADASAKGLLVPKEEEDLNISLKGVSESNDFWWFQKQEYKLVEGRHITADDAGGFYAIISETLADANQIKVGDRIKIKVSQASEECELAVAGIHSGGGRTASPLRSSPENILFLPFSTLSELKNDPSAEEAAFSLSQASRMDSFVETISRSGIAGQENLTVLKENYEYLKQKNLAFCAKRFLEILIVAIYTAAVMIIVLLTVYLTLARMREFGVLLSMGEKKRNIILQLFFELLVPAAGGMVIGLFGTVALGSFLRGRGSIAVIDAKQLPLYPGNLFLGMMVLFEIMLILAAVSYPAWKIMRYSPKQILQR